MKKNILIGVLAIALAAAVWALSRQATIRATNSFEECVAHGYPVQESYPRQCLAGRKLFVEQVPSTSATTTPPVAETPPAATPPVGEPAPSITISASGNMRVYEPDPNDEVGLPLVITGEAREFENTFSYLLKDGNGRILVENVAMTGPTDLDHYGSFEVRTSYGAPRTATGVLEVFSHSARDGSEIDMVRIPVRFASVDAMQVKVFFRDRNETPPGALCDKVELTYRRIPRTATPLRAALDELLAGPTLDESSTGLIMSINTGVKILGLSLADGIAKINFDRSLVAVDDCQKQTIRAEIEATALQFPTVRDVVITVNGRVF